MKVSEAVRALSLFLGDFDPARFFAEHWEQRALHLTHGDPGRFADLISPDSLFDRELERCAHVKASARDADGWNQEIRIRPDQARKLFRAGMTICATMLDEAGPCGRVVEAYRRAVTSAAPPHVNCYYSPDQRGYGLHFDTHPVWILQVAGVKHWTFSREPGVVNPPFNVVFPPGRDRVVLPWITLDRPDLGDYTAFQEIRLEPGDVLYLPAGCWHAARAEGTSLALTLAQSRITTFDAFNLALSQIVAQKLPGATMRLPPFPRESLPGHEAGRAEVLARLETALQDVKAMVARLDGAALLEVYDYLAAHPEAILPGRQLTHAKGQVEQMKAQHGPDRGDRLPLLR